MSRSESNKAAYAVQMNFEMCLTEWERALSKFQRDFYVTDLGQDFDPKKWSRGMGGLLSAYDEFIETVCGGEGERVSSTEDFDLLAECVEELKRDLARHEATLQTGTTEQFVDDWMGIIDVTWKVRGEVRCVLSEVFLRMELMHSNRTVNSKRERSGPSEVSSKKR